MKITDPTAVRGSIEVWNQDIVNLGPIDFEFKRVTVPFEESCLIYSRLISVPAVGSMIGNITPLDTFPLWAIARMSPPVSLS